MLFLWVALFLWAKPPNFAQEIRPQLLLELSLASARADQTESMLQGKMRIEEALPEFVQVSLFKKEVLNLKKEQVLERQKELERQRAQSSVSEELKEKEKIEWRSLQHKTWEAQEVALSNELKALLRIEIFFEQCSEIRLLREHFDMISKKQQLLEESLQSEASLTESSRKEIQESSLVFLKEEERIKKFYWELFHHLLGGGSLELHLNEELNRNFTELNPLKTTTSNFFLHVLNFVYDLDFIDQKLEEIKRDQLRLELTNFQKILSKEKLIEETPFLEEKDRNILIQELESSRKQLLDEKKQIESQVEDNSEHQTLKLQMIALQLDILSEKEDRLKSKLDLELQKTNIELEELREQHNSLKEMKEKEFHKGILILQEQRAKYKQEYVSKVSALNDKKNFTQKELSELKKEKELIEGLPPLDPDKDLRSKRIFNKINSLILEQQTVVLNERVSVFPTEEPSWPEELSKDQDQQIQQALSQVKREQIALQELNEQQMRADFSYIKDLKILRRDTDSLFRGLEVEEDLFWEELNNDISLTPWIIFQTIASSRELFLNIINFRVSEAWIFLKESFQVVVLLMVWWFLLRKVREGASVISQRVSWPFSSVDLVLRNLLYAALPFFLMMMMLNEFPVVSWGLRVYAFLFLFRCIQPIISASFVAISEKQQRKLIFSLQILLIWWSSFSICNHLFIDILHSDRLNDLLLFFRSLFFWGVVVIVLHHWEEVIAFSARNNDEHDLLQRALNYVGTGFIGKILISITGLVVLFIRLLSYFFFMLVKGDGWVGSLLAERTVQDLELNLKPLSEEEKLKFSLNSPEHWQHLFQDLEHEKLIVFVGELDRSKWDSIEYSNLEKRYIPAPYLHEREALEEWLFRCFGVFTVGEWIEELSKLPPTSFHIAQIERTILRKVGGYSAIERLFQLPDLIERHQFIFSIGPYCWGFLQSEIKPISLGRLSCILVDKGLPASKLVNAIKEECQRIGWKYSFFQLSQKNKNKETLRRVEEAYWRLLWESSGGDLEVAKQLYLSSLFYSEEQGTIEILLFNKPKSETLSLLSDQDKFLLMALLIHSVLAHEQISDLLSISKQDVLKVCSALQHKHLLRNDGNEFFIPQSYRRSIAAHLKEQRLLF